jgi:bacterioferritin
MKAKEGVVDLLNETLTIEMTAINQYFLAGEQCANWGFPRLRQTFRGLSFEEMKDTQELVQHILYLEGLPNMQRLNQVLAGENVLELLRAGLALELGAVDHLRRAIAHCAEVADFTTRAFFEEMIVGEEKHVDLFETQLAAIDAVGIERYLAQQITDGE